MNSQYLSKVWAKFSFQKILDCGKIMRDEGISHFSFIRKLIMNKL